MRNDAAAGGGVPTVLDFGLHRGEDTAHYLATGANVIAFEANPVLVSENRARFADAIAAGRLTIVEGAIVPPDHRGDSITFYVDQSKTVWGTTSAAWAERNAGLGSSSTAVTVPTIDLVAILRSHPRLLYAKIDIEGADQYVLQTLAATDVRPDFVSIESEKVDFDRVVAEIEQLQGLGYTRFAAVQQATIPGSRIAGTGLTGAPFSFRFDEHASGPFGPFLRQPFKPAGAVIDDYRRIFARYRRFGDQSLLMRSALTRMPTRLVSRLGARLFGAPLCGWYDTHAAR